MTLETFLVALAKFTGLLLISVSAAWLAYSMRRFCRVTFACFFLIIASVILGFDAAVSEVVSAVFVGAVYWDRAVISGLKLVSAALFFIATFFFCDQLAIEKKRAKR